MRDQVARVRRLLEEATERTPTPQFTAQAAALQAFTLHELNQGLPHFAEQTPRARSHREIMRIANWYGWIGEIDRALDAAGSMNLSGLSDDQTESLLTRMKQLEECIQNGGDAPDAPPAR